MPRSRLSAATPLPGAEEPIATLARRLRETTSATRLLAAWCAERGIGEGPIRAERHPALPTPPEAAAIAVLLEADRTTPLRHRRVTLWRGAAALSDCDIWWLPGRIAPSMRHALDTTDRPFGLVVEALHPTRRTLAEALLPGGGAHVLDHRALLLAGSPPRPCALVRERYRRRLVE
ncbi:hypothetical protein [Neoroseomonas lacus]|uniref:hypothetical protein n=1 Tax=Neoroseomonas lacus TaxID=287609 RepID=UPI00166C02A1|nr:hypothetical protein [Neoroseomonas lacus]